MLTNWLHKLEQHLITDPRAEADPRARMRQVLNSLILHIHPTRVPASALRFTYTWGLGGISAVLCLLLICTGILLMFRYEPTVARAYVSIQRLETSVPFGSLCRALHHWSANLLVVSVFLHLLRVFLTGGYKKGRGQNWVIGLGLLFIVLAFNFTGYLLPWDQLAYWAVTVSTSIMRYIPLLGDALSETLLQGHEVGQGALSNFYALHVAVLPALLLILLTYHFWRIRKDGGISQPERAEETPVKKVTTVPHLVQREVAVGITTVTIVVLWAMLIPAPLGDVANPQHPPNPAKAAWYFGALQELLLHMDTLAALIFLALIAAGVILLPWWDRADADIGIYFRSIKGRKAAVIGSSLGLLLIPLLIVADEFWIDWMQIFPGGSPLIVNGFVPLTLVLLLLGCIYGSIRWGLRALHSEALVGLFGFIISAVVVMTVVCALFRGPNMALTWPFS